MDTLRGTFDPEADRDWDAPEDESAAPAARRDLPPEAIGQDERRMQVRAYNHWASLLGERMFPHIDDLDPAGLADFGPYSVLLDFSEGIEDPKVRFLGARLAQECGSQGPILRLSDVPPRSLLSRITDHYLQILANQAPIGFEAEFVNQRGAAILYRGILLPFSRDDATIDFIYGVINWKELADQITADELLLEIDQALELESEPAPAPRPAEPLTDWADSPAHESLEMPAEARETGFFAADEADADEEALPDFSRFDLDVEDYDEDEGEEDSGPYNFASLADYIEAPAKKAINLADYPPVPLEEEGPLADFAPEFAPPADEGEVDGVPLAARDDMPSPRGKAVGLRAFLEAAQSLARSAESSEDRSRAALYAAVSRAYDFALAAAAAPQDYAALVAEAGIAVQERAPMTPVVKLVFGADYDKTRLTEYAAVLSHARRLGLGQGQLADFLAETEGGIKAVVQAERRLRREEQGRADEAPRVLREAIAAQLRARAAITLEDLDGAGPEFALVLIRRDEVGCAEILGELPEDIGQIERAARKLGA